MQQSIRAEETIPCQEGFVLWLEQHDYPIDYFTIGEMMEFLHEIYPLREGGIISIEHLLGGWHVKLREVRDRKPSDSLVEALWSAIEDAYSGTWKKWWPR